jgi:hypothetical protein
MGPYPQPLQGLALTPKENMSLTGEFGDQISNLHYKI